MQEGIYHVRFSSSHGNAGEGLAVIKAGAVNGGDTGYLYYGRLGEDGATLSGHLDIAQWNTAVPSIFGPIRSFKLALKGTATSDTFTVAGGVAGQPAMKISIAGRRLASAV